MTTTAIGLSADARQQAAHQLATLLADEFVLYTKTLRAHWNVEGPDFFGMHSYLQELYQQAAERTDDVAERMRQLGHYAPASLGSFLQLTHLTERNPAATDSASLLRELLQDHESIIEHIRGRLRQEDAGTADLLTGVLASHEKTAWMLRAHLQ